MLATGELVDFQWVTCVYQRIKASQLRIEGNVDRDKSMRHNRIQLATVIYESCASLLNTVSFARFAPEQ